MANVMWTLTTGDNWDTAADWSSGVTPGTADAVWINTNAVATVTHASAVSDAIASLSTSATDTLSVSAGSLTVYGAATLQGAVAISAGCLALDGASTMASLAETGGVLNIASTATLTIAGVDTISGGAVCGGTLATAGATTLGGGATLSGLIWQDTGTLVATGGTLCNVTYDGALGIGLTATSGNQYLFVTGGLTLKNAAGTGNGTATLGSANGYGALIFENSQTVNNATINLVSTSSGCDGSIDAEDTTGQGQVLTLGGGLTVNSSGAATNYIGYSPGVGKWAESVVNAGTINVLSGKLVIVSHNFTNTGTINITGGSVDIDSASNFTNAGTIWVGNGATFNIYSGLPTGGLTGIGGVAGGIVNIDSTVNNTGATFSVASGASFVVGGSGTISGGTIFDPLGLLCGVGGTLSGVTYDGPLALGASAADGYNQYLFVTGGLTLKNPAGTGNGTATLGGAQGNGTLIINDTETVNNATINLVGNSGHFGAIEGSGTNITLGGGLTVNSIGTGGNYIGGLGDIIVNAGTINAAAGTLAIRPSSFTNNGAISVAGGGNLTVCPTTFINQLATTLTGGSYAAAGMGSTVEIYSASTIQTLYASLTLSGTGSVFETVNVNNGVTTQIDTSLTTISASGRLLLLAGRALANTNAFSNAGLLQLAGGTFKTTSLTVAATGKILGFGTVTPSAVDQQRRDRGQWRQADVDGGAYRHRNDADRRWRDPGAGGGERRGGVVRRRGGHAEAGQSLELHRRDRAGQWRAT